MDFAAIKSDREMIMERLSRQGIALKSLYIMVG
jgi:hypothetical protein